jgi:hypothetical protein
MINPRLKAVLFINWEIESVNEKPLEVRFNSQFNVFNLAGNPPGLASFINIDQAQSCALTRRIAHAIYVFQVTGREKAYCQRVFLADVATKCSREDSLIYRGYTQLFHENPHASMHGRLG